MMHDQSKYKFSRKKTFLLMLSAVVILAGSPMAACEASDGALSVRVGSYDDYQRVELAWESPALWSHRFSGNGSRLDLVGELGAAYWHTSTSGGPASLWQFSAVPMVRWSFESGIYLEAGAGPTLVSSTHFAGEALSTALQFGDHIGAGVHLSSNSRIGVRFSHFSNANIKRPNPGLNLLQVLYTYQY